MDRYRRIGPEERTEAGWHARHDLADEDDLAELVPTLTGLGFQVVTDCPVHPGADHDPFDCGEQLQQEGEHRGEVLRDREMTAETLEERAGIVADRLARTGQEFEAELINELLREIEECRTEQR